MPIEIENLSHSYKTGTPFEHKVLYDVSFSIDDGEFVGLIGPTRSGKTTLAQHLNALYIPRQGKVIIDHENTADKKADLVAIRHRVGYVFQNPEYQLFAPTVGEDVAFGPKNQNLSQEEIENLVKSSMEIVGLNYETFCHRDIFALSGGQKRRAAIAGVLACRPKVLVLDDITSGLDPRGREEIMKVVKGLHHSQNITILFISNSMDEVALLAQRLLVMNYGEIIMDGPTREVFAHTEKLRSIGLELPEISIIIDNLRSAGFALPTGILTIDEAISEIIAALHEMEEPQ
ncbi:MAG: energy-coupling factor transporter ATPase [Bacillota bacterium]